MAAAAISVFQSRRIFSKGSRFYQSSRRPPELSAVRFDVNGKAGNTLHSRIDHCYPRVSAWHESAEISATSRKHVHVKTQKF